MIAPALADAFVPAMMDAKSKREEILTQLNAARASFHTLVDSLSEQDLQKQSLNPSWTNGEILAHMTFGFIIINVLLPMARLWDRGGSLHIKELERSSTVPIFLF